MGNTQMGQLNKEDLTPEQIASSSLLSYVGMQYPKYYAEPMHELIATALEAVEAGRIRRLLINTPPQNGKTFLTSEFFPAWVLGRHPDWKIIAATYNQTRANEVGGVVRNNLISSIHQTVFPNCEISQTIRSTQHVATTQRGHYYAIGVGGTGTGRGANCLSAETLIPILINGQKKDVDIHTLYLLQYHNDIKVLAFDHNTNTLIYKRVVAARRLLTNELYEISTDSGHHIRATGDHRFFVSGRGYINVKTLRKGDRLTINQITQQQNMHRMWYAKEWQGLILQNMLQQTTRSLGSNNLRLVRKRNNKKGIRNKKSNKKGVQRSILFSGMFNETSCHQEQKKVHCMWGAYSEENQKILFASMQKGSTYPQTSREILPTMWENVSSTKQSNKVLLQRLCRPCTFRTHDGERKLTLQGRNKLYKGIYGTTPFYTQERQRPMCSMQCSNGTNRGRKTWMEQSTDTQYITCTPYRRRSDKQYPRKFNIPMHNLPCDTPQIVYSTISSIKRISGNEIPVYDIQVEGTSNFFANKILTHNCFLIDDPLKGQEDAESKIVQKKIRDWYRTVVYTRLRPDNRIVIIQTRWNLFDLTGFVLEEHAHENWKVIQLRAVAEEDDILGRKVGEALCPSMYPIEQLNIIKTVEGTHNWEALFQQRPIPRKGGMIQYDWIENNYYEDPPKEEEVIKTVISWDTAYRAEELNDPTAATVWQITKNNYYLIDVFNKKLEFYKIIRKIKEMHSTYHPSTHLIEGRASGQSIIDELKRSTTIPVVEISTKNLEKSVRLDAVTGLFESGKVRFPDKAPWLIETKDQLCLFPSYRYDDITDSVSQFLNWVNKPRYVRRPPSKLYWK